MKKYIAERNARKGVARSGLGDMDAPSMPATETSGEDNTAAPSKNVGQDGVEN